MSRGVDFNGSLLIRVIIITRIIRISVMLSPVKGYIRMKSTLLFILILIDVNSLEARDRIFNRAHVELSW